jgi:hypothetical protein
MCLGTRFYDYLAPSQVRKKLTSPSPSPSPPLHSTLSSLCHTLSHSFSLSSTIHIFHSSRLFHLVYDTSNLIILSSHTLLFSPLTFSFQRKTGLGSLTITLKRKRKQKQKHGVLSLLYDHEIFWLRVYKRKKPPHCAAHRGATWW